MSSTSKLPRLFASLLLAASCQAFAQQKSFVLDKPMQEDIVACMEEAAAEKLFQVDVEAKHNHPVVLPEGCYRFATTVTYRKLVHRHVLDGVTYSVYEATIRSFSVFVPMKGVVHRMI